MLALFLAALGLLIFGIYRATRRWGVAVLWDVAAGASALDASGVVAERLWGPRYSWNLAHHGWDSLPASLMTLCFSVVMAHWFRSHSAPR